MSALEFPTPGFVVIGPFVISFLDVDCLDGNFLSAVYIFLVSEEVALCLKDDIELTGSWFTVDVRITTFLSRTFELDFEVLTADHQYGGNG